MIPLKPLSKKHQQISASLTLEINAKASALRKEGKDVLSFASGEPNQNTPEAIRNKAIQQINDGPNGYTAAPGLIELRTAVANKLLTDNDLTYAPEQVVISSGAKHALFNALQALCNPGDEIIQIAPYWVSYPEMIKMAGAVPKTLITDKKDNFLPQKESLNALITSKTKAIIINSPSNPTGVVYPNDTLQMIGEVAEAHDLYIISDEIYEKLIYEGTHQSIASLSSALKERTILINGVSKAYAMTGWRIGYSASNPPLAKMMSAIQSHATSNANTIAQHAAIEALEGDQSPIKSFKQSFEKRREMMCSALDDIRGIDYIRPTGAFYVMVDISSFFGKTILNQTIEDSISFCKVFLEEALLAVVPGIAFAADEYIRFSYATDERTIEKGMQRLKVFCEKYA